MSWRNFCILPGLLSGPILLLPGPRLSRSSLPSLGWLLLPWASSPLPWAGSPCPGLFSWHPQLRMAAPLPPDCEACSHDAPEWRCSPEASWDALAVVLASSPYSVCGDPSPGSLLLPGGFPVPRVSLSLVEAVLWLRAPAPVADGAGCNPSSAAGRL